MTNLNDLLPVGSVVLLKEAIKKLMIIGVLQTVRRDEEITNNYDYMGVLYPEGFLNLESVMLFNHEQINDVVFRGYENPERQEFIAYVEKEFFTDNVEQESSEE